MAGKGVYALAGVKPGNAKALSAAVTAKADQAGMMARSSAAASFMKAHQHLAAGAGASGESAAKVTASATPKLAAGADAAKQTVATKGPTVARAKDFADSREYVVTTSTGKRVKIFRDKDQFSYPVWHMVGDQHNPVGIGSSKADAVAHVERTGGKKTPAPHMSKRSSAAR